MGKNTSRPSSHTPLTPGANSILKRADDDDFNAGGPQIRMLQDKLTPLKSRTFTGTKKVAIVGGGVSGVVTAWQLMKDPRFDVTLYEAEDEIGGAVRTRIFKNPKGEDVVVDTAVVFTEESFYPNCYELFTSPEFNITTEETELGVTGSFMNKDTGLEEFWSNVVHGMPLRWKFRDEANRFMLALSELQGETNPLQLFGTTAQHFIDKYGFSNEFIQKAMVPMLLTFAITRNGLLSVPLAILHIYFGGGALEFVTGNYGRRAKNGWGEYMKIFAKILGPRAKTSHKVTKIFRNKQNGVDLTIDNNGNVFTETYDEIVVCILKDQALQLLGDSASTMEKKLFSMIEYEEMRVLAHNDPNVISPALKDENGNWRLQYFNYRYLGDDFGDYVRGATTYVPLHDPDIVNVKEIPLPLLTYANATDYPGVVLPDPSLVLDEKHWRHVKQSIPMFEAGVLLHTINGKDRIWYAGNDVAINFHEGALCSGLVIAKAMGTEYPFKGRFKAEWVFNLFEKYMLEGAPPTELVFLNPH